MGANPAKSAKSAVQYFVNNWRRVQEFVAWVADQFDCDGRTGWNGLEKGQAWAHIEAMIMNALKLVVSAGLVFVSVGAWPYPRFGAAISIGVCVMAAMLLHFVLP